MLVYFLQALQVRTLFDSSRILLWLTKVVLVGLGAFCLDLQKGGYCWCIVYGSGYTYSSGKARLWPGDVCRGVLLRSSSSSQHTVDHIISHVGYTAAVSYQKQTVLSTCIINGCLLFGQLKCSFKSYLSRYCLLDDCLMTVS